MQQLQAHYVVDADGNPVAVLLDIKVYRQLLEALEELEAIQAYDEAKASGQQPVSLEEALRSLEESHL